MPRPKRVLCIMDLALAGRSSLAVALPVLSACGVQACPLPTALFSTHTGGFGPVEMQDVSDFGEKALQHFVREHISFDAIYVGYLCEEGQFALAEKAFALYPRALRVVDPALGDNGRTYSGISGDTIRRMHDLCEQAQLTTPNYTECALLAGKLPGKDVPDTRQQEELMRSLTSGGRSVVVTSVPTADGFATAGGGPDGTDSFIFPSNRVPQSYPGSGDALCSALIGQLLAGLSLQDATRKAVDFIEAAVRGTYEETRAANQSGNTRHGVWLEPHLHMLCPPSAPAADA